MFANVTLSLMGGFVTTVQLFCLTLVFALPLGLLISFGSMSRITPLRALIKIIVWIVRGTPLMLQIIIIYYGPALAVGIFPAAALQPLRWLSLCHQLRLLLLGDLPRRHSGHPERSV